MEFRLAAMSDLEQLKEMYRLIVNDMNAHNIQIWDDIYPCEFLKDDIQNRQMYILLNHEEIIAAFSLCNSNAGENKVTWDNSFGKAIYLDRLGINIKYKHQGYGALMIAKAKETARKSGFEYLRLFVVDINVPALQLYEKNGFVKAEGFYNEVFDDGFVLHEYGYEIKL